MSRIAVPFLLTAIFSFPIALGCKADPSCEPMRRDLAKAWGTLRESAMKRKLAGVDVEGWARVEDRVALLESSFATRQVTWPSADKALAEVIEIAKGRKTDSEANLIGYTMTLDAAVRLQEDFKQRCH